MSRRAGSFTTAAEEREAWVELYERYFHRFSNEAWVSMFGLSLQEVQYLWDKYRYETGLLRKDVLLALHFVWVYPTQQQGAAIWKMHRNTYNYKCWVPVVTLGAHMHEIKLEARKSNLIRASGPASHVTLYVDATDCPIGKPKLKEDQRRFWTFKNRAFAKRYVAAVSVSTGDLCWRLGGGGERLDTQVEWFERIGGDGAYLCRRDPKYVTPRRKPRGRPMPAADSDSNRAFGATRVIVENVFSRLKGWRVMTSWRHHRDLHDVAASLVFQLTQVKNKFRPVRANSRNQRGVKRSWDVARATGSVPRAKRPANARSIGSRASAPAGERRARKPRSSSRHAAAQDAAMRRWEAQLMKMHARDSRADRVRQRALARDEQRP
eukprot:jgi/Bigna1/71268/fgenesh1_pg.15_\